MKRALLFLVGYFEEIVAAVCLASMVAVTFTNVMGRYFFSSPLAWGDEVAVIFMAWAVFLGMSAAFKHNLHLGMEFFLNKFTPERQLKIHQFLMLIVLGMSVFLTYVSYLFVMQTNKRTPILRLSYQWIYYSAVLGFLFMSVHAAVYLFQSLRRKERFKKRYFPDIAEHEPEPEGDAPSWR